MIINFGLGLLQKYLVPFLTYTLPTLAKNFISLLGFIGGIFIENIHDIFHCFKQDIIGLYTKLINRNSDVNIIDEIYSIKDNIVYKTSQNVQTMLHELPLHIQNHLFGNREIIIDQYNSLNSKVQDKL
jgi:hypothetical protein